MRSAAVFLLSLWASSSQAFLSPRSGTTQAGVACASIAQSLGPIIVQSIGEQYTLGAAGAWNLFNDEYQPTCIVFPTAASHVQTAMAAIFQAGSQYAVQAGGHSAMVGWNNVGPGVLILFSNMQSVSYTSTTDTITVQPGARWGNIVDQLSLQGVAPVGGRQGDVGTGFLLGGGLSFLSPMYGFGADSIVAADVVLVNGTLVTATTTNQYSDLLRALKGGGNRFGIVTRYELKAIHTGTPLNLNWYGGSIIYPNSSSEAVLTATANYVAQVTDPKAALVVSVPTLIIAGTVNPTVLVDLFYMGSALPPSIFGSFLSIPNTAQTLGPLSYVQVASTLPPGNVHGLGQHFGASALVGDPALFLSAFKHFNDFTEAYKDEISLSTLAFTPVSQSQIAAGRSAGGNAISPPDGGYAAVQIAQVFKPGTTSISADVQAGIDLLFQQVPPSAGKPLFLNECDKNQNVFATYGGYDFLKSTYAQYDPTRFNVGHMNGPIGL